jgi:hypothetical protein
VLRSASVRVVAPCCSISFLEHGQGLGGVDQLFGVLGGSSTVGLEVVLAAAAHFTSCSVCGLAWSAASGAASAAWADRQQHCSQCCAHVLVEARLRMFATLNHCHVLLSVDESIGLAALKACSCASGWPKCGVKMGKIVTIKRET